MINKDLNIIKEHWEKKETKSLGDKNLQELERMTIINYMKKINKKSLKDIGCGDGSDTIHFSKYVDKTFAYDYSQAMLEKASLNLSEINSVSLNQIDILEDELVQKSDLVITKRMLINLGNFNNQKKAIKKIYDSLEKDGYFIMLETSSEGLKNLNELRKTLELEAIAEPFHNVLFNLDELKYYLEKYFIIEDISYFSTYFFLTRVYNTYIKDDFKYDTFAKNISVNDISLFEDKIIGPQFCFLLKKK